ncbi:hypothetical protein MB27_21110 [Actinoplanes utahensis]|uniref:Uncharacterized protein n=1 Tax=Actinoplanes utahensis TaxID=1869 RepID=A0A0A6UJU9_ACTUT|nr:hypothetical protein MB27_21110 [Actinoplanes utahensis]
MTNTLPAPSPPPGSTTRARSVAKPVATAVTVPVSRTLLPAPSVIAPAARYRQAPSEGSGAGWPITVRPAGALAQAKPPGRSISTRAAASAAAVTSTLNSTVSPRAGGRDRTAATRAQAAHSLFGAFASADTAHPDPTGGAGGTAIRPQAARTPARNTRATILGAGWLRMDF